MQRTLIIIAGALYSLTLFYLVGDGFQAFGIYATIAGLLLHLFWKKSGLGLLVFFRRYAFLSIATFMGAIGTSAFMFDLDKKISVETTGVFIFIIPAYILIGLAWFISCDLMLKKLHRKGG